jgi:pilus assembly protein CpaB
MRPKSLLAFAMAIGCGLIAMFGVQQALKKQDGDPDADKVQVYTAIAEIPPGAFVDPSLLEKKPYLKETVPEDAVTDPAQLDKRALIVRAMPGDIIRLSKLADEGKSGASISIPVGMRVVTVPANMTFAHSGMVKAEDRVDLMVTYKVQPPSGREYSETKTFLTYIQVFATDSIRDPNADLEPGGKTVVLKNISLLVTPEQAQTIQMAKSIGELALNLRNTSDKLDVEVNNLTPDQFRTQILQASVVPPSEHEKKGEFATDEQKAPVVAFADDMAAQKAALAAAQDDANTEAWDITIFSKNESKVETVEVERRKEVAKATRIVPTDSKVRQTLNSILDMFHPPQKETVVLKPVQVGRPIGSSNDPAANLQARLPKGNQPPTPPK